MVDGVGPESGKTGLPGSWVNRSEISLLVYFIGFPPEAIGDVASHRLHTTGLVAGMELKCLFGTRFPACFPRNP